MGSTLKADSDRRELVRERREARIERRRQRRDARERKRSQSETPRAVSRIQRAGQEQVDVAVDRIVSEALEHHDQITALASATHPAAHSSPRRTRPTSGRAVNGARLRGERAPALTQRTPEASTRSFRESAPTPQTPTPL